MSIATELTRAAQNAASVNAAKTAIASAITAKGGTVGTSDGLADFPAAIAAIPSGGGATEWGSYKTIHVIEVTSGQNTVSNSLNLYEYFKALIPDGAYFVAMTLLDDDVALEYNEYVCGIGSVETNSGWRYRNGTISSGVMWHNTSFDAVLPVGRRYALFYAL